MGLWWGCGMGGWGMGWWSTGKKVSSYISSWNIISTVAISTPLSFQILPEINWTGNYIFLDICDSFLMIECSERAIIEKAHKRIPKEISCEFHVGLRLVVASGLWHPHSHHPRRPWKRRWKTVRVVSASSI